MKRPWRRAADVVDLKLSIADTFKTRTWCHQIKQSQIEFLHSNMHETRKYA